jgi:hypothetical protein
MGDITYGGPQTIKFLGLGTSGLPYSIMSTKISEPVSNVKISKESNNSSICS